MPESGAPAPIRATEALRKKLAKIGLHSEADLLVHLPLRYEDETSITPVAQACHGAPVQVEVVVLSSEIQFRPRRQMIVRAEDESGELTLRFFSFYPSQQAVLSEGSRIRAFGEVRGGFFGAEMVHPRFRKVAEDAPLAEGLTPIYPTTAGLANSVLQKLITRALADGDLSETLDEALRQRLKLPGFARSLRFLHAPPPGTAVDTLHARNHPAWRRVKFDEVLAQQLSLRRAYLARRQQGAPVLVAQDDLGARLVDQLPFGLTGAQLRAMAEIAADLAQPYPMQRLLQGDVGAGKTIVAALAACQAISAGWQAAFMAPTEILAEQHYLKLRDWLEPLGIRVAWLSGSLKSAAKRAQLAALAAGAQLVVGTHALIQDGVDFARLGLAIVDEQHRFGVAQRLALRKKGANPHQLMMSATPIPRTLAMSYYADLDVTVLDELPPGRTPIKTRLVADNRREDVVGFVTKLVGEGRQAYWVCPLIEESEALQLQTAQDTYEQLSTDLPLLRIGLVHGRLKADEKQAVMAAFAAGEIDVLVATTVIEVGVDVPNASLMVIEHAERFGLSQLHQLRGRVGRGAHESSCVLVFAGPLSETARQRLKIIFENTDGFEIARQDLHLRGPGEFVGSRQSGVPLLRYADLEMDADLVDMAREVAEEMLLQAPDQAERHLRRWLGMREELLKS
ncbi:ATP-dependent DNA helicase RecG [Dechloromonas denitrificans]|uniref:ATP-dependent DNA helicase RecG n=1 Tax=Dechloromonas denitrificans TaxID=281362 RepID=UPI001CF92B20|nr:ATP-dependent DNA helicase RecG [Dechloromonas denitrificans]UCV04080.1 ATP-dependent DNA helicase RecG [Dechloromonas denitrificans]UCV08342.1 ATP-dependent DNA helicase RecG [Dechloromonas denitrificans]